MKKPRNLRELLELPAFKELLAAPRWYASSLEIERMGPFATQKDAWEHLELTDDERKRCRRVHVEGARVWPVWDE